MGLLRIKSRRPSGWPALLLGGIALAPGWVPDASSLGAPVFCLRCPVAVLWVNPSLLPRPHSNDTSSTMLFRSLSKCKKSLSHLHSPTLKQKQKQKQMYPILWPDTNHCFPTFFRLKTTLPHESWLTSKKTHRHLIFLFVNTPRP